jgi:hypothetical protein
MGVGREMLTFTVGSIQRLRLIGLNRLEAGGKGLTQIGPEQGN